MRRHCWNLSPSDKGFKKPWQAWIAKLSISIYWKPFTVHFVIKFNKIQFYRLVNSLCWGTAYFKLFEWGAVPGLCCSWTRGQLNLKGGNVASVTTCLWKYIKAKGHWEKSGSCFTVSAVITVIRFGNRKMQRHSAVIWVWCYQCHLYKNSLSLGHFQLSLPPEEAHLWKIRQQA